jgi:hypothetical protein
MASKGHQQPHLDQFVQCMETMECRPHGIDQANRETKSKAKLRPSIVVLYVTTAQLDYMDKCLFELPLDDHLRQKSLEQVTWIYLILPTV